MKTANNHGFWVEAYSRTAQRIHKFGSRRFDFAEQMEPSFFRINFEQLAESGVTEADVQTAQIESYQWLGEP